MITPSSRRSLRRLNTRNLSRGLLASLLAFHASLSAQSALDSDSNLDDQDDVVELSPFEVNAEAEGYQALNSMSGTRLNTKLEDLGSSIAVITKQEMDDFGMLGINDVLEYVGNAEGAYSFNSFGEPNLTNGSVEDMNMQEPENANRIRGVSSANVAMDNFKLSNRIPMDAVDTDGVEVGRGPNSSIFGIGQPGGTVNIVGASANTGKHFAKAEVRADSYGGWRTSLDVNRYLFKNKLAIRASLVQEHEGFVREPAGVDKTRFNAYVTYRPFKNTTIKAAYRSYQADGTRANTVPPIDGISYWESIGSPTWNPLTGIVTGGPNDGQRFAANNPRPDGFGIQNANYNHIFVDPTTGIDFITALYSSNGPYPDSGGRNFSYRLFHSEQPRDASQALLTGLPQVSDKSMYDWSKYNLAAPNSFADDSSEFRLTLDQHVFDTERQSLDLRFGYFEEDSDRRNNYLLGITNTGLGGNTGRLVVDVNEYLLDGTPNPYFLRPYLEAPETQARWEPLESESLKADLAYSLSFTENEGWTRWLGNHRAVGYAEYKDKTNWTVRYNNRIGGDIPTWLSGYRRREAGQNSQPRENNQVRTTYRFYVGDAGGYVNTAPGPVELGEYSYSWGNFAAGTQTTETTLLAETASRDTGSSFSGSREVNKAKGFVLQSEWLNGRLITTFGRRLDEQLNQGRMDPRAYNMTANPGPLYDDYGLYYRPLTDAIFEDMLLKNADGNPDWVAADGDRSTQTYGGVLRPFMDLPFVEQMKQRGDSGFTRFFGDLLDGLALHYNYSDSFQPTGTQVDLFGNILPHPRAEGTDYGFAVSLFDDKLYVKVNFYENLVRNGRGGPSASIANNLRRLDFGMVGDLLDTYTEWNTLMHDGYLNNGYDIVYQTDGSGNPIQDGDGNFIPVADPSETVWSQQQIDDNSLAALQMPAEWTDTVYGITEPDEIASEGMEIDVFWNPSNNWTVRAGVAEKKAYQSELSERMDAWYALREPVWTSVVDPFTGLSWWDNGQVLGNTLTPHEFIDQNFVFPSAYARNREGLLKPQMRRYSANFNTSYKLRGISDHKILKKMTIGGSLRWQSKSTIGYYGLQQLPDIITEFDQSRPITVPDVTKVDLFVSYRTRLAKDKVGLTLQLNARNITENGHLQPIVAWPDGTLRSFHIIDPRQYIVSAKFDF